MNRVAIMMLAVMVLAGCATQQLEQRRAMLVAQGHPPAYVDGHVDGCSSGTSAAGNPYFSFAKNVTRYQADKLYADGWNDGFAVCKARYDSIDRGPGRY